MVASSEPTAASPGQRFEYQLCVSNIRPTIDLRHHGYYFSDHGIYLLKTSSFAQETGVRKLIGLRV